MAERPRHGYEIEQVFEECGMREWSVDSGAYLPSTLFKLPHQGNRTSSSRAFLHAVGPQVAVIAVQADNEIGHPSASCWSGCG